MQMAAENHTFWILMKIHSLEIIKIANRRVFVYQMNTFENAVGRQTQQNIVNPYKNFGVRENTIISS